MGYKKCYANLIYLIAVITVFVAFALMSANVPLITDDYGLLMDKINADSIYEYIRLLLDHVIERYNTWSGRIVSTVFGYVVSSLTNNAYAIANSLIYVVVFIMITRIIIGNRKECGFVIFILSNFIFWACMPGFGDSIFWRAGSAVYLWTSLAPVLALLVWNDIDNLSRIPVVFKFGFCIVAGLLGGVSHENMAGGLLVIMTMNLVYSFLAKKKIEITYIIMYVATLLGFAILVMAPGNHVRMQNVENTYSMAYTFVAICYYWMIIMWPICVGYVAIAIYLYYNEGKALLPNIIDKFFYLFAAFCAAFCLVFAHMSPERTWFIVVIYGLIGLLKLVLMVKITKTKANRCIKTVIIIGCILYLLVGFADTFVMNYDIYGQFQDRERLIKEAKTAGIKDIEVPAYEYHYPLRHHHDAMSGCEDLSTDPMYWVNIRAAEYYGVDSIRTVFNGCHIR